MQSYRNLEVWKIAHALTLELYRDTATFPRDERYGLTGQIRRAASSIGANIAEGCGRGTDGELRQSLGYAMGSATELDYHLLLSHDLGFLSDEPYAAHSQSVVRVQKMLSSFILRLRPSPATSTNGRTSATAKSQQPTAKS